MSKAWARGSTYAWRTLRARVLRANAAENGGRCQVAIEGVCTGMAECVHHTKGRAVTGDDVRFLVASCTACNLKIGDPTKGAPTPDHKRISEW